MNKHNIMAQYETTIPFEYTREAVEEIAMVMGIDIDCKKMDKAMNIMTCSEEEYEKNCVCVFVDKNDSTNLFVLDTGSDPSFHGVLVRCHGKICDRVKQKLEEVDKKIRIEWEDTDYIEPLENTIDYPPATNPLNILLKRYKNLKIPNIND